MGCILVWPNLPPILCAPHAHGFLPSDVSVFCESNDRNSGFLYGEPRRSPSRMKFWRGTTTLTRQDRQFKT